MRNGKRIFSCFMGLFCCLLLSSPAGAISISIESSTPTILLGDNLAVDIVISGFDSNQYLGAFDMDIGYNASILSFNSYSLGDGLGDPSVVITDTPFTIYQADDISWGEISPGLIDIAEISWLWPSELALIQSSTSFSLATLYFTGIAPGASLITVNGLDPYLYFGDEYGNELIPAQLDSLSVTVTPVPEPATLMLFVAGLVGVCGIRKKSIQSKQ